MVLIEVFADLVILCFDVLKVLLPSVEVMFVLSTVESSITEQNSQNIRFNGRT